jgi:hypothetical protein
MKNLFKKYIDKRIEEVLRKKEVEAAAEKWKIDKEQARRKKANELNDKVKQSVNKLISEGICSVSLDGYDGLYDIEIPYEERSSSIVRKQIRQTIMENIVTQLFTESSGPVFSNYVTFSLSEGLKQDLQKLYNIKSKEK